MKYKLIILNLVVLAGICIVFFSTQVSGTCDSGINKNHLDKTAKAFVDNTTLEINDANGIQIKAHAITAAKISNIFGSWTDKDSLNNAIVGNSSNGSSNAYRATSEGFLVATLNDVYDEIRRVLPTNVEGKPSSKEKI